MRHSDAVPGRRPAAGAAACAVRCVNDEAPSAQPAMIQPEAAADAPGRGNGQMVAGMIATASRWRGRRRRTFQAYRLTPGSGAFAALPGRCDADAHRESASIEVRLARSGASSSVRALARRHGRIRGEHRIQAGNERLRAASIELRVPIDALRRSCLGPQRAGQAGTRADHAPRTWASSTPTSTARVANAHRLEDRLLDVLAQRPGKLQDILAVERELARVREEIERYEGRLRYLQVARRHEPPDPVGARAGARAGADGPLAAGGRGAAGVAQLPRTDGPCDRVPRRARADRPGGGWCLVDVAPASSGARLTTRTLQRGPT